MGLGELVAPIASKATHIYFLCDGVVSVNASELKHKGYHFGEVTRAIVMN